MIDRPLNANQTREKAIERVEAWPKWKREAFSYRQRGDCTQCGIEEREGMTQPTRSLESRMATAIGHAHLLCCMAEQNCLDRSPTYVKEVSRLLGALVDEAEAAGLFPEDFDAGQFAWDEANV